MKLKRIFLLVLAGCCIMQTAAAADTTNAVKQLMQKVQQAYRSANYLSFHVVYRYANKSQPDKYIDTMSGEVVLDKNRMRFMLEDVETVTNERYSIQVMKAEKLIYLSTPKSTQLTDPVSMLDSVLTHMNGLHTHLMRGKGVVTLQFIFPPGKAYKNVTMIINESTGYFEKVLYELYTEGLVEKDQLMENGNNGMYQSEGRVEVLFSQYRQGQITEALFNEARFFTRLGQGKYEPSEQYKDYQVFLASPKL
jgi:hypothetical protein